MKKLLIFLPLTGPALAADTDVLIWQRDSATTGLYRTITGSSNANEAIGFDGSGVLTSFAVQTLDSDLTSWAGVTRAAGFDTFAATPSTANLASLVTGETGSGAVVFGTSPTFTTSILLGSAGVSIADDGDGAITFLGLGNGSDEDLTLNFDDTADKIVWSSSTGAANDLSGMSTLIGPLQGSEGSHLHVIYSAIGSGTAYTMTASYATVDMGTTDPSITIAATGTYRIYANVQVNFAGATYAAFDQATFKLRRTNNTAADLTDGERGCSLPIMTTTTMLGDTVVIGPIEYATANVDDVIVVQGDLNSTPSAGSITVTKCTIFAERVRQ